MYDLGIGAPMIMQNPSPEAFEKQYTQLHEMCESLVKFGVDATVDQLVGASMDTVLAETEKLQADLIIIGSHRHSTFYKLLIGSVTEDVLQRARCPVLVVPNDPV
jgi:nucleotide-binding universal stress UspA family protein